MHAIYARLQTNPFFLPLHQQNWIIGQLDNDLHEDLTAIVEGSWSTTSTNSPLLYANKLVVGAWNQNRVSFAMATTIGRNRVITVVVVIALQQQQQQQQQQQPCT